MIVQKWGFDANLAFKGVDMVSTTIAAFSFHVVSTVNHVNPKL